MNTACDDSTKNELPVNGLPGRFNPLFRKLIFLIPVGIIGNTVFCLITTDGRVLGSVLHFQPAYLFLAAIFSIVPWFTGSLRLFTWSRFLGQPIGYRDAFRIAITADLAGSITPPMVGGSAVKIGMLMNRGFKAGTALSLPVLENMEDGLFFLIMIPLALTITSSWNLPYINDLIESSRAFLWYAAGMAAAVSGIILLVFTLRRNKLPAIEKTGARIRAGFLNFLYTFHEIGVAGKKVLVFTMVLTAFQWVCRYSIISLLLASIGIPVQPVLFMVLQVFVFALMSVIPTPGAAGGAEIIFSLLYTPFLPSGTVGIATLGWRFFTFYFHTLLAALLTMLFGLLPLRSPGPRDEQERLQPSVMSGLS